MLLKKYLGLFDADKNEEKFPLDAPIDIFKYEEKLIAAIENFEPKKAEV